MRDERGGTAVEYGFILALVVLMMIAALVLFARTSVDLWDDVSNKVTEAGR